RSRRTEIAAAYWFTWRRSWRMRLMQAWIATVAFLCASSLLRSPGRTFRSTVLPAALWAMAVLVLLPLYPQLSFKSQPRRLTIDPGGIHTTIGSLKGDIPWRRVASISTIGDRAYAFSGTE